MAIVSHQNYQFHQIIQNSAPELLNSQSEMFEKTSRTASNGHTLLLANFCFQVMVDAIAVELAAKEHLDGVRDVNGTAKTKIVVSGLSLALQPQL